MSHVSLFEMKTIISFKATSIDTVTFTAYKFQPSKIAISTAAEENIFPCGSRRADEVALTWPKTGTRWIDPNCLQILIYVEPLKAFTDELGIDADIQRLY